MQNEISIGFSIKEEISANRKKSCGGLRVPERNDKHKNETKKSADKPPTKGNSSNAAGAEKKMKNVNVAIAVKSRPSTATPKSVPKKDTRPSTSNPKSAPTKLTKPTYKVSQPSVNPIRAREPLAMTRTIRKPVSANTQPASTSHSDKIWNFDLRPPDRDLMLLETDSMLVKLKVQKAASLRPKIEADEDDGPNQPKCNPSTRKPGTAGDSSDSLSPRKRHPIGNNGSMYRAPSYSAPEAGPRCVSGPWNTGMTPAYMEEESYRALPARKTDFSVPITVENGILQPARQEEVVKVINATAI